MGSISFRTVLFFVISDWSRWVGNGGRQMTSWKTPNLRPGDLNARVEPVLRDGRREAQAGCRHA